MYINVYCLKIIYDHFCSRYISSTCFYSEIYFYSLIQLFRLLDKIFNHITLKKIIICSWHYILPQHHNETINIPTYITFFFKTTKHKDTLNWGWSIVIKWSLLLRGYKLKTKYDFCGSVREKCVRFATTFSLKYFTIVVKKFPCDLNSWKRIDIILPANICRQKPVRHRLIQTWRCSN